MWWKQTIAIHKIWALRPVPSQPFLDIKTLLEIQDMQTVNDYGKETETIELLKFALISVPEHGYVEIRYALPLAGWIHHWKWCKWTMYYIQ